MALVVSRAEPGRLAYLGGFRGVPAARALLASIADVASALTGRVTFMEFCGGHTNAIGRQGIRMALPDGIRLLSGPGCPVCVTAQGDVDAVVELAGRPGVTLATFGDMMRVPGGRGSLLQARGGGADVRVVYSPLDALGLARQDHRRDVVFVGVGFETTAPGVGATMMQARREGVANFSVLSLHKLTPPAMRAIIDAGEVRLDGIIGPGHVSTVIGADAWRFLPDEYGVGCAIAGFEPTDILSAIRALAAMAAAGVPSVANCYPRSVRAAGNPAAAAIMDAVFEAVDADWRGLGSVPASGLAIREEYSAFDARERYGVVTGPAAETTGCRCGEVLRGAVPPEECPLFAGPCTPETPVGPCMVSSEGTCAAYYEEGSLVE